MAIRWAVLKLQLGTYPEATHCELPLPSLASTNACRVVTRSRRLIVVDMSMDRLGHLVGSRDEVEAMDWAALQRAMMEWADHLRVFVSDAG